MAGIDSYVVRLFVVIPSCVFGMTTNKRSNLVFS